MTLPPPSSHTQGVPAAPDADEGDLRPTGDGSRPFPRLSVRRFLFGKSDKGGRWPLLSVFFALAIGILGGVGSYTFQYAEGFSYFKTDPKACVNCHIMQPQYDAWQKSSHHAVAVCVDCHLPHDFFSKYIAKAENGWRHGKLFTTGGFKEPIEVQEFGQRILQENCESCHEEMISEISRIDGIDDAHPVLDYVSGARPLEGQVLCVHCHSTVGHGVRAAVGGPMTKREELR